MKIETGNLFIVGCFATVLIGGELLISHLMLPGETSSQEAYRTLITKWFAAGFFLGMGLMFCLIESWMWRNWRSWNKFCCDHHERVYRATMGLHKL